jgi:hypothetical protein
LKKIEKDLVLEEDQVLEDDLVLEDDQVPEEDLDHLDLKKFSIPIIICDKET